MRRLAVLVVLSALALAGCPRSPDVGADGGPPDASRDASPMDAQLPDDAQAPDDAAPPIDAHVPDAQVLDAGRDASRPDGGTPLGSMPAPPAEVLRTGTGGFLLRGTVLAPEGPIEDGEVLVVGNTITCVAADCSAAPSAGTVTLIDTHATISPGLIDAHNHSSYNFLPEWIPAGMRLFGSRYEWRADPEYRAHVAPEAALAGATTCAALRWAELRSLVHGTTTVQGQAPNRTCAQGLVRNAEHHHGFTGLGDRMRETIAGACESGLNETARASLVTAFRSGAATRHAIHMAEGYVGSGTATTTDPTRELDCYAGRFRFTTSLLQDTDGTPFRAALFIHSVPFDDDDLMESMAAGARFVWSPSSNILLYGRTAPIGRMLAMGLPVALGPDWTLSGSDELLSEMRFALEWAAAEGVPQVTPRALVDMATTGGADAIDQSPRIGRLAAGLRADIAVFGRVADDPYLAVTDSRAADVRLVMIDGRAYYGDVLLETATSFNSSCDMVDACGTPKFLCAAGTTAATTERGETVDELEQHLRGYLDAGEFVLTGADLLPLIDCSI